MKGVQDTPWLTLKQEGSTLVIINNKLVDGAAVRKHHHSQRDQH
ncbi:MAG: hypothetical protein ACLTXT_01725 [Ruminococcus callidus]